MPVFWALMSFWSWVRSFVSWVVSSVMGWESVLSLALAAVTPGSFVTASVMAFRSVVKVVWASDQSCLIFDQSAVSFVESPASV